MADTTSPRPEAAVPSPGASPGRPMFVLGCARSGTTLLQLMLHAHPRMAVPPETRFVPEAYHRRVQFGDLSDTANLDGLLDWIMERKQSKFRDLHLDPDTVRRRAHEVPPTLGSVLGVFLEQYAARWDKPRWGDKRPSYVRRMPLLLRLFPDAQFIHIIRDGRDCVASLKRMPWWEHGVPPAVYYWVQAMRAGDWARANLRADQYVEVYYEDLVLEPRRELQRLCDFLAEPFDEAMLEPNVQSSEAVPKRKRARWHERTTERIDTGAVGKWRGGLEPEELRLMESVAGRRLRAHGYELSGNGRGAPPQLLTDYARHVAKTKGARVRQRRKDRRRDRLYPWPLAAQLTSTQRQLA